MMKHIIAALLCVLVMLCGWHDGRALLPLLPYLITLIRVLVDDTRRLMEVDMND